MKPFGMEDTPDEVLKINSCVFSGIIQCIYGHQLQNYQKGHCVIIEMFIKMASWKMFLYIF